MKLLEIIFMIFLAMSAIYVIFNIADFIESWYKWIIAVVKGLWFTLVWLYLKVINIFKRG